MTPEVFVNACVYMCMRACVGETGKKYLFGEEKHLKRERMWKECKQIIFSKLSTLRIKMLQYIYECPSSLSQAKT